MICALFRCDSNTNLFQNEYSSETDFINLYFIFLHSQITVFHEVYA